MEEQPTAITIDDKLYIPLEDFQRVVGDKARVVEEKAKAIANANAVISVIREQRNNALDELALLKAVPKNG
jgi:hypothetical protein